MVTVVAHERELIEAALAKSKGRIAGPSGAAAKLGIPRQTLESKIRSLGIDRIGSERPKHREPCVCSRRPAFRGLRFEATPKKIRYSQFRPTLPRLRHVPKSRHHPCS